MVLKASSTKNLTTMKVISLSSLYPNTFLDRRSLLSSATMIPLLKLSNVSSYKEMCWHDNKDFKSAVKPAGTGIDTGLCVGSLCS